MKVVASEVMKLSYCHILQVDLPSTLRKLYWVLRSLEQKILQKDCNQTLRTEAKNTHNIQSLCLWKLNNEIWWNVIIYVYDCKGISNVTLYILLTKWIQKSSLPVIPIIISQNCCNRYTCKIRIFLKDVVLKQYNRSIQMSKLTKFSVWDTNICPRLQSQLRYFLWAVHTSKVEVVIKSCCHVIAPIPLVAMVVPHRQHLWLSVESPRCGTPQLQNHWHSVAGCTLTFLKTDCHWEPWWLLLFASPDSV